MKALKLAAPGGLDRLAVVELDEPGAPGPGEIRVRIRASSLNFHDLGVVSGRSPTADGRIPMSDGAGEVEAVGDGVSEFAPGDLVVSCFFPFCATASPKWGILRKCPATGSTVTRASSWSRRHPFHPAPRGYSAVEAATLTTAGLTAWRALIVNGGLKAGDVVLALGTGGVSISRCRSPRRWARP